MVEQIRVNPEEVRGYGNVCEEHSLDDFIVSSSGLAKEKGYVHGALTSVYKLVYSLYGLMFDFDKGNKQLYLQVAEADTLSFGFDTANKQLYLVDEDDIGFSLGFDEDTNELYITDDAPPIVHVYSLALDQSSYTTTGSLSVSATLLDDGVAVEGATVSFSGGVSTVTATTNSSGVATATVNFTSSGTLTASYSNVSDTASVTVSHDYSLAFSSSSYAATDGSAEVSVTLLDDNVAVTGATISFTGGTSTVTGVTNSSGVATATVSVSATSTITATYNNVTDTCTVTVGPSYLFYDACDSDNTSQYTTLLQVNNTGTNATLTYDSTEQAYSFLGSGGDYFCGRVIPNIRGEDDIKIRCKVKFKNTNAYNQFFIIISDSLNPAQTGDWDMWRVWGSGTCNYVQKDSTKYDSSVSSSYVNQDYCYIEIIKESTSVTANLYDSSMNVLKTTSQTGLTYSNPYFAIGLNARYNTAQYGKFIKEIKVESV